LKEQGTSIIFITHKLREVKAVGDRSTVIRRGKVVGTAPPSASEAELAVMMLGREVSLRVEKGSATAGDAAPEVKNVTVVDPRGHQVVKDVSFQARAGEVLGIAGVQGNGQTELVKSLLGLVKPDAGQIFLGGQDITRHGPRRSLEDGIGYIPEDRSH
ncbi:ATP-binding cassette domain-containing protein, partial|uniref:ATP-binding cassette domain-containing protein n=1 Tax=Escherichia coli TaxID=562 RepID=UPI00144459DC